MKALSTFFLFLCLSFSIHGKDSRVLSLAGEWHFQLDPDQVGVEEKWFGREFKDVVKLPGTTDENQKGTRQDEAPTDRLAREWYWKGAAWYQKEVVIPESWKGKRITLFLERTKNARVWVDEKFCGWDDSLSAPHVHDLSSVLTPGKHRITLLIDNSILPPVGPSHAVDERTQTNWNGVVGELELRATDPVWIKDVQVFPDVAKKSAIARVTIRNSTGKAAEGQIQIRAASENTDKKLSFDPLTAKVAAADAETTLELECRFGDDVPLWSEFDPALIRLTLDLETGSEGSAFEDQRTVRFGMRDFRADGSQLTLNGMNVFLRGRLDCANYPLTGYAPMSKEEWVEIYQILKDWGLNHVRFHSWCPPKAAFEAADEAGFYLQAELPNKRSGFKAPENQDAAYHNIDRLDVESSDSKVELYDYAKREAELIFEHFGNHPSFVMFTLGNELGRNQGMFDLVELFKKTDPRHIHAQGANNMHWNPSLAEGDEFWVTGKVEKGAKPLRGSFSLFDFPAAPIEGYPPSTMDDFNESIEGVPVPLIGHETGQFQVAPDFRDIPKFTGVLKAKNYEIFRSRLEEAGMLDQAELFVKASGALSALCYREDIELALRTPGFGGFQLLDIMDFPGQGTALVGMLNVFMESKGVITPIEWRRFCAPVVPLVRMEKHAWTSDESFEGLVQVAHYGANDLPEAELWWSLTGSDGNKITDGKLQPTTVNQGGLVDIGRIRFSFSEIETPQRLDLTVGIEGDSPESETSLSYPLWVYPPEVETSAPEGVKVSRSFQSKATQAHLSAGGKVLLIPELDKLPHSVPGGFQSEFWSPMFAQSAIKRGVEPPPGTLGILCDPQHPVFRDFPTEFHTNWQWWHLLKNSKPIKYDETPDDYRPIVQVIDNFVSNHKLGLLAETRVGKGSMLICPIDLPNHLDQPAVRQFQHSLLRYMDSKEFAPAREIHLELLNKLLPE